MGSIEFYGIIADYESVATKELSEVLIPDNIHIINECIEVNELNLILFSFPIVIIIMAIIIIKQIKTGFLNKNIRKEIQEENIKKYNLNTNKKKVKYALKTFFKKYILITIIMCSITIVHEYLHAIAGAVMGYNMKIAIGFPMGGITWVIEDMTKFQSLVFSLTPLIILGIIPSIVAIIMKVNKKNYLINWLLAIFSCLMIFTSGYDIIDSYNVIKNIPNGTYTGQSNDVYYWYNK